MLSRLLIVLLLVLLCAGTHAQDVTSPDTDWTSLKLTLTPLKTWGTKHYRYSTREPGGKAAAIIGAITLGTEVTEDALILRDSFQITYREEKLSLEVVHTCRTDSFLSPIRIESKGEGSDKVATFVATVAKGKATVRSKDGRDTTIEIPDGTITMAAMMRLVTLVPRTPGKTYSYKYSLESEELNLKKDYRLIVLQPETITSGNQQVKCSKFQLAGGGINPVYYWVTKDGLLQRVLIDDRKVMELKGDDGNVLVGDWVFDIDAFKKDNKKRKNGIPPNVIDAMESVITAMGLRFCEKGRFEGFDNRNEKDKKKVPLKLYKGRWEKKNDVVIIEFEYKEDIPGRTTLEIGDQTLSHVKSEIKEGNEWREKRDPYRPLMLIRAVYRRNLTNDLSPK